MTRPTGKRAFTPEEVRAIRHQGAQGHSAKSIAVGHGCPVETVRKVLRWDTYADVGDMPLEGTPPGASGAAGPGSGSLSLASEPSEASLAEVLKRLKGDVEALPNAGKMLEELSPPANPLDDMKGQTP
jgi:hypothetical protein